MAEFIYEPTHYLQSIHPQRSVPPYALLVLNQDLRPIATKHFESLWQYASYRICADGGANRLYEWGKANHATLLPDRIHGDLDSIRPEVKRYYESQHCKVTQDLDQNSTDFTKCIETILAESPNIHVVWTLTELAGRFDQTLSIVQTLYTYPALKIYLLSSECLTFLLFKGKSQIHFLREKTGKYIGLLPVGRAAKVSTLGLRWDLNDEQLEFGGIVSTSNAFRDDSVDVVCVASSEHLLFTISVA